MDARIDLEAASRDELIALIVQQQAVIGRLERRIAQLEDNAKPGGPSGMPGLKPRSSPNSPAPQQSRKPRPHGFSRRRMAPTHRVEHTVESCPDCGTPLSGGWTHRTREVIDLPRVPAHVTEHVFIARVCPRCRRNCLPQAELDGAALGKQRLGVNLVSLIATLREEGRLPIRSIQWYLRTVHQLRLSVGAIVAAIHRMAQQARHAVSGIVERIRGSPVVHADETGWREDGANGYGWTFSTPTDRYFLRRGRGKSVVDEVLGDGFAGVLVCDFYAAYHHYDGPKQRCWAHLLRDIHDLQGLYPDGGQLAQWAEAVHGLYAEAKAFAHPKEKQRRAAQQAWEQRLLAIGRPFLDDRAAAQAKLCRRIERHIKELFVFVGEPAAPSDNNAAERSLRHLVVSRKVSGGTRSAQGTDTKMILNSLFGSWRAQGLNPLAACRQLLLSPQL